MRTNITNFLYKQKGKIFFLATPLILGFLFAYFFAPEGTNIFTAPLTYITMGVILTIEITILWLLRRKRVRYTASPATVQININEFCRSKYLSREDVAHCENNLMRGSEGYVK